MSDFGESLEPRVRRAVRHYWSVRNKQARRQGKSSGVRDTGLRSAVTGGAQLNGFIALFEELLAEAGLGRANVFTGRSETVVPGFYRPTKAWDLVAVAREQLVACIEIKSQAGPSFGNNFNNRVEEAIGNAADFWKAYEQGLYRAAVRPFLGYMMLLEDAPGSTNPVVASEPHFSVLPEFQSASYAIRYKFFGEKLLKDRLYDSVALLMSRRGANKTGDYSEPSPELTVRSFVASLMGRAYALSKQG